MASLFVIQGADQGKRFELKARPMALGRDNSNPIRLHDTEVSRRHAEVRRVDDALPGRRPRLGQRHVRQRPGRSTRPPLRPGDRLQLGQTVMLFSEAARRPERDLTARVDMLGQASPDDRSAILRSIPAGEGSRVLEAPDVGRRAGSRTGWSTSRSCTRPPRRSATSSTSTPSCPRSSQLVFESIGADRGAILLKDDDGELVPKAVRWRRAGRPRRADDDLADDRRPRPRAGAGGHHLRRPGRQAVRPGAVDRRLRDPRGDLRARSRGGTPRSASSTPTSAPRSELRRRRPATAPAAGAGSRRTT